MVLGKEEVSQVMFFCREKVKGKRGIIKSLLQSPLLVAMVWGFLALIGYQRGLQWHSIRKGLEGIILLTAIAGLTGQSLGKKMWWPAWPSAFLYLAVYPVIIILSRKGWVTDFNFVTPYFLMAMAVSCMIVLLVYMSQYLGKLAFLPKIVALLVSLITFFNTAAYLIYSHIYKTAFVAEDMLPILQTHPEEARGFVTGQIGIPVIATGVLAVILFALFELWLIRGAARSLAGNQESKKKAVVAVVLILACLYLIGYWGIRTYPFHEFKVAQNYIHVVKEEEKNHNQVKNNIRLTNGKENALPQKLPGTVLFIIGESENRDHMSAFNPSYPVETTPWLSQMAKDNRFTLLSNGYSNFPQTTQSLAMAVTSVNQYNHRKLDNSYNIIDIAKAAGYDTWWISNHSKMGNGTTPAGLVASWSDHPLWTDHPTEDDMQVMKILEQIPKEGNHFIVIHVDGSHFIYKERIPPDFQGIHVEGNPDRTNQYDSTVLYTDKVLQAIFDYAEKNLNLQAAIYTSDHGEDMVYSHGASRFTYDMVRIPVFFYLSEAYEKKYPSIVENLKSHQGTVFTNDLLFDSISGIIRAESDQYEKKFDLTQKDYDLTKDEALTKHGQIKISEDTNN